MKIRRTRALVFGDELRKLKADNRALRVLVAVLLQEVGGRFFVSDEELVTIGEQGRQIVKRRSTTVPGYDLSLESLPEA